VIPALYPHKAHALFLQVQSRHFSTTPEEKDSGICWCASQKKDCSSFLAGQMIALPDL